MTQNTDAAASAGNETIRDIITFIDEDELNALADGSITTEKGTSGYNQYINFEDTGRLGGYVKFLENDEDVTSDFLYFKSGVEIARYSLEFKTSFQSDVEDSTGTKTTAGTYLGDLEDEKITILGKEYTIVKARRGSSAGNSVELTLMGGVVKDTLAEGETKTYTVNEKDYEVTLIVVTDVGTIYAKFKVNNETTSPLEEGDSATLSDGTEIVIAKMLPNEAGDVTADLVQFYLGKPKIYLKDTNIKDMASSNALEYGSEKIDDTYVIITGTDDNSTFSIDTIQLNITADDDYYVAAGHSLTEYMEEPQAFLESWDIRYDGLDPSVEMEIYKIKTSGSNEYELEFVDGDGNRATVPILYTSGDSNIKFGDNDDDLVLKGSMKIKKNDYLIVSDYSKEDGRNTYALRYKGANKVEGGSGIVKFDNLGTGKRINQTYTSNEGGFPGATLKLGGATFGVINASDDTINDFEVWVDLDADGNIQNDNDIIAINTNAGMEIELTDETGGDYILAIFSTPNEDDYDNIIPTPLKLKLSAFNRSVYFEETNDSNIGWVSPSEEQNVNYSYTSMGAKFKWWKYSESDPDLLTIEYPKEQRLPWVYIVAGSYEVCSPRWVLNETWSECINGSQYKNYHDMNDCSTNSGKPDNVYQECDSFPPKITFNVDNGSTISNDLLNLTVISDEMADCWVIDHYGYPINDLDPPLIFDVYPLGRINITCFYECESWFSYPVIFSTSEKAECRIKLNEDTNFENMNIIPRIPNENRYDDCDGLTFTFRSCEPVSPIEPNITIYSKCKDPSGNFGSYNWSIETNVVNISENGSSSGGGGGGGGGCGFGRGYTPTHFSLIHEFEYNLSDYYDYVFEIMCKDAHNNSISKNLQIYTDFCVPNWQCSSYDSCQENDRQQCTGTIDLNSCYNSTNLPSDQQYLGDYSEFSLGFCDYDNNGIIGKQNETTTNIGNLSISIGNSTDLTQNFTGKKAKVEFKEENETVVEFEFNFSEEKLNLANITIEKQEANATNGGIILSGIDLTAQGETKTVFIDRLAAEDYVCVKDEEIASITEFPPTDCSSGTPIPCPGSSGAYTCSLVNNDTQFKVEGLSHSGITESTYSPPSVGGPTGGGGGGGGGKVERTCVESWTCTDWEPTICPVTRQQTRTCTDRNNCGTETNKPNEIRTCFYYVPLEEKAEEVVEKTEEALSAVAPTTEAPPIPKQGMLAITGAAIGGAYKERPLTVGILTVFILLIVGLFIYSHAKNLTYWPFHFKFPKKKWLVLVIIVLIVFILLFVHFVLLTYFRGLK